MTNKKTSKITKGGGVDNLTPLGFNLGKTSNFFKPLIASSLALALGMSGASAACTAGSSPIFCAGADAGSANDVTAQLSNLTWTDQSNEMKKLNNGTQVTIDFNANGTSSSPSFSNNTIQVGKNNKYFSIVSGTNAIQFNLAVSNLTEGKTFVIDASQGKIIGKNSNSSTITIGTDTASSNTGTSKIIGGTSTPAIYAGYKGANTIKLGGAINTIQGAIKAEQGSNAISLIGTTNTINAQTGTSITLGNEGSQEKNGGLISVDDTNSQTTTNTITLNGTIKNTIDATNVIGKIAIYARGSSNGNATRTNTVSFSGGGTSTIIGKIQAEAGSNKISFADGINSIEGNISVVGSNLNFVTAGSNTITFGQTEASSKTGTSTNIIKGDITINDSRNIASSNTITFNTASATNTIQGNITAEGNGTNKNTQNTINFNGASSENTITGDILAKAQTNTIQFLGTSNTITGNITAQSGWKPQGFNTITVNNNASSNTITGKISASAGVNTITLTGATNTIQLGSTQNEAKALISAQSKIFMEGEQENIINGSNTIKLSGSNSSLIDSKKANVLAIQATNGSNHTKAKGTNTISLTSSTNNTIKGAIRSYYGSNAITLGNASSTNKILAYDGVATDVEGLIVAQNGENTITFSGTTNAITSSSGIKMLALKGKEKGLNKITFKSGTNTIEGITYAFHGKNELIFDAGTTKNEIQLMKSSQDNNLKGLIYARGSLDFNTDTQGINNITLNGTTNTISNKTSQTISTIRADVNGSNTISFTTGTTNTVKGQIRAEQGSNTIDFANTTGTNIISKATLARLPYNDDEGYEGIIHSTGIKDHRGINTITLNGTTKNEISGGDIKAIGYGTNTIKMIGAQNLITGNLLAKSSGGGGNGINNIYMKNSSATPSLIGNITSMFGTNNVVFENGFWVPYAVDGSQIKEVDSGILTTKDGGTSNLVFRQGEADSKLRDKFVEFKIINQGNYGATLSTTNLVMQLGKGKNEVIATKLHIDYQGEGAVTAIYARNNNIVSSPSANDGNVTSDTFVDQMTNPDTGSEQIASTDVSVNRILGVTYKDGVRLTLQDKKVNIGNKTNQSLVATYGNLYRQNDGSLVTITSTRISSGETSPEVDQVKIEGLAVGNITSLASTNKFNKEYQVELTAGSAFAGGINLDSNSKVSLTMGYDPNKGGAKLILGGSKEDNHIKIATLKISDGKLDQTQLNLETLAQRNTVINLATGGASAENVGNRQDFRLLEIGSTTNKTAGTGLQGAGDAVFVTYINANAKPAKATLGGVGSPEKGTYGNAYSDRIIIHNSGANDATSEATGSYYLQFAVDVKSDLKSIKYATGKGTETAGNIAVATVAKKTNADTTTDTRAKGIIRFQEADMLQGFDQIGGKLKAVETDANGKISGTNNYITYFVDTLETKGAAQATQEASSTALATNYDLYLANFNSLNKRMGELRNNDHSQGAWIRIFNGSQNNDFGLGTKTSYTTFQGGYDYAFGFEGANNYLGLAIAYGMSSSKTNSDAYNALSGQYEGIKDIKSNLVEVALYNAYVQDEGWYNDTIAKFSYIMSDFTMLRDNFKSSTNNMAFTLSDEFGYRFKLGGNKEWYIDPQLELGMGYFNQTDFVQKSGLSTLNNVADAIFTLRSRLGSSFGYDFKNFTQSKDIKASVYLGAFYEFDYVNGGAINLETNLNGKNQLSSAISSDGRVAINLGTNVEVKDNTRIYFDFESSFAGKIRTDYQVNLGVRYSFGENTGYTPSNPKAQNTKATPLKLNEENKGENEEKTEDDVKKETSENKEAVENKTEQATQEKK